MCFLSLGQSSWRLTLTFLCLTWSAGWPRAPGAAPGDGQSRPLCAHGRVSAAVSGFLRATAQAATPERPGPREQRKETSGGVWGEPGLGTGGAAGTEACTDPTFRGSIHPALFSQSRVRFLSRHSCTREAARTKQRSDSALTKGVILAPLKSSLLFAWKQKAVLLLIKS